MSEHKRNNRKSNQNKEPKRIILAKKSDEKPSTAPEKPRILLKPKDTPDQKQNNVTPITQISIASRPTESVSGSTESNKTRSYAGLAPASALSSTPTTSKDGKESSNPNDSVASENIFPSMKKPFSIISDHYQFQTHAQDFLIETNTDFVVVGIIGTQASGKSFCLNLLNDDEIKDFDDIAHLNRLIKGQAGVFRMRNQMKETLSNQPYTEGIQMYITKHRTILLDCAPVLCNPYKKEAIYNECDDLKMLIFLLNVCNTLIVVEDCGFNLHLLRLIAMADSMKIDVYENDVMHERRRHSPNILLFKNKCQNHDFLVENKLRTNNLYRTFFKCSGLNAVQSSRSQENTPNSEEGELDVFYFPWIDMNEKNHYQPHPDLDIVVQQFREYVFMTPVTPFSVANQQTTAFTEKHWYHLALSVWDSHKTSYFLRKFEQLKEKEWALRV